MTTNSFRILARELSVEEIQQTSGGSDPLSTETSLPESDTVSTGYSDQQTSPNTETGGCTDTGPVIVIGMG